MIKFAVGEEVYVYDCNWRDGPRKDRVATVGRVNVTLERESGRIYSAATGIEKRTRYTPQRLYTLSEYDLNNRVAQAKQELYDFGVEVKRGDVLAIRTLLDPLIRK